MVQVIGHATISTEATINEAIPALLAGYEAAISTAVKVYGSLLQGNATTVVTCSVPQKIDEVQEGYEPMIDDLFWAITTLRQEASIKLRINIIVSFISLL